MLENLPLRGIKGTTGTQASFLELFNNNHDKVKQLDLIIATKLGFNIYDIRDFFDNSFVKEYEESVIKVREYFSQVLERCTKKLPYNDT